jgi:hypothetical protein
VFEKREVPKILRNKRGREVQGMKKARIEVLREVLTKAPSSGRLYHVDCGI